jgi:hypothetical protein
MLTKTRITLALALVAATPGTAYAQNNTYEDGMCVAAMHNGGWIYLKCLVGRFK